MHARTQYTPLTVEEQRFAAENHQVIFQYLRSRKLDPEEWYDVVVLRYLLSVKKWFQRPELHTWKFSTIARQDMRSAIGSHLEKEARRIQTVSLDEAISGFEGMTYMDTVTADNLDYINYGEEDMNISYNVKIPERANHNKSDEVKALENFLEMKDMRNMCIECADAGEAKKTYTRLYTYRKKYGQQELYEVFRVKQSVYVVKAETKAKQKESKSQTSGTKKGVRKNGERKISSVA